RAPVYVAVPAVAGIAGGDDDRAPRLGGEGIDIAADRARSVVGATVAPEADIDDERQLQFGGDRTQVVESVAQPLAVAAIDVARRLRIPGWIAGEDDARQDGVGANADVAGGDAGHVRAGG